MIKESEYTKQEIHDAIAHHLLTSAQPVSKQWPVASFLPSLYTLMMSYSMEYAFGHLRSAVSAVSLPAP